MMNTRKANSTARSTFPTRKPLGPKKMTDPRLLLPLLKSEQEKTREQKTTL